MEMPAPDNTLPMMTGTGQFGPIEMGGMFTVMKIREGLARDDYRDPGPYQNPPGTVAYAIEAPSAQPMRRRVRRPASGSETSQADEDGGNENVTATEVFSERRVTQLRKGSAS